LIVFCLPQHRALLSDELRDTAGLMIGRCRFQRFPDGELYLKLEDTVAGMDCGLLGSLAPPDAQTLSTLLLADTLKRAGARRILAVLPYLGYARQDRPSSTCSLGAAWVASQLASAGVDEVVTIDIHSEAARMCFPMPVTSLSPAGLLASELARESPESLTVVAPDEGARERAAAVAGWLGIPAPVAYLRKHRTSEGVVHRELVGSVGPHAALIDDILDTGSTLLSACAELRRAGVRDLTVMATHGTLSGERWRDLMRNGVRRIVLTDTIPGVGDRSGGMVEVLPIAPLLSEVLQPAFRGVTV